MQVSGAQELVSPFLGHGVLILNNRATDNIRGRSVEMIIEQINSLGCGVTASLAEGTRHIVLESESDFTIGGNQDVLDVFGLEATV